MRPDTLCRRTPILRCSGDEARLIANVDQPRPWDPSVRITHWGIAAAVILNGLILDGGAALTLAGRDGEEDDDDAEA
jgi:hypothetical protein